MGVCNCSMFCCTLLYVHSSSSIILMGKRELVALLSLSPWCLVIVVWLFLAVPWVCLRFMLVVFPDHTHLLFFIKPHSNLPLLEIVCRTHDSATQTQYQCHTSRSCDKPLNFVSAPYLMDPLNDFYQTSLKCSSQR